MRLPGSLLVKTSYFQCRGHRFNPCMGTKGELRSHRPHNMMGKKNLVKYTYLVHSPSMLSIYSILLICYFTVCKWFYKHFVTLQVHCKDQSQDPYVSELDTRTCWLSRQGWMPWFRGRYRGCILYLIMSQRSWVQELAAKCESLGDLLLLSGRYRDQSALQCVFLTAVPQEVLNWTLWENFFTGTVLWLYK